MSSLDPFGPGRSMNTFKPRKSDHGLPLGRQVTEAIRDIGSQMKGHGKSGKGGTVSSIALAILQSCVGLLLFIWSFRVSDWKTSIHAIILGSGLIVTGLLGALTSIRDIPSLKSTHIMLAVVVGLLGWSFADTVSSSLRTDCILAETYLRLDHLESAMHNVRHEEMINGIMMRLDHLNTDIEHLRSDTDDKMEESQKKAEFKQQDAKFVDNKLRDLISIAEDAIDSTERQIQDLQRNITALEDKTDDELSNEQVKSRTQLKAKVRSLKYRQKILTPRKQKLQDIVKRLEGHISDTVTSEEYTAILGELEKLVLDKDILPDLMAEKDEAAYVAASADRLTGDNYDEVMVGDFSERAKNRSAQRTRQRKKYERYMNNVYKTHDNKLMDKSKYLASLSKYLDEMPSRCIQDLEQATPASMLGWSSLALALLSMYVGLTHVVSSVKKDF